MRTYRCFAAKILAIFMLLNLVLCGCSGTTGESTTAAAATGTTKADETEPLGELTVYLFKNSATAQQGYFTEAKTFAARNSEYEIHIEAFDDVETMEERLKTELTAGQGPDVIMADSFFGLDIMELARNGALYDMTDIIAADDDFTDEQYYMPVMKAGQIEDRQYVIPLSFTVPTFVSSTSALEEAGIDWNNASTMDVYRQMLDWFKSDDTTHIGGIGGYFEAATGLLYSMGKSLVDPVTGKPTVNGEEERVLIELGAELVRDYRAWMDEKKNIPSAMTPLTNVPMLYTCFMTSPWHLQIYYSAYLEAEKESEFEMFMAPDEDGNYHAVVQEFAAVTANTDSPELAWYFISSIIDHEKSHNDITTAVSLNRWMTNYWLDKTETQTGKFGPTMDKVRMMPREYSDELADVYDRVVDASIYQVSPTINIVRELVIDYVNGETDFETAIEDMESRLNIYANE